MPSAWSKRILGSRQVRTSAQSALTSGEASHSRIQASENSRASAAAVAELADGLDFLFETLDFEEEPGDVLQFHLGRLLEEVDKYPNSRVGELIGQEWACPTNDADVILAACRCSSYAYHATPAPKHGLIPVLTSSASLAGTSKAMTIWRMESAKTLVVAVRGTASPADHMVNLSTDAVDATPFLGIIDGVMTIRAHGGYLAGAKALASKVEGEIGRQIELDSSIEHVVFTGHSAGGAVAGLLFLYFANRVRPYMSFRTKSLITFGSPPVTTLDVTKLAKSLPKVGMVLAYVNEFDLIPRADHDYIRSLLDLYRSSHGLPPVDQDAPSDNTTAEASVDWPLPSPKYFIIGDILLLRNSLQSMPDSRNDIESDATTQAEQSKICVKLSARELSKLIFCDLSVHKGRIYLERVGALTGNKGGVLGQADTLVEQSGKMKGF